jgi:hypothetical protein
LTLGNLVFVPSVNRLTPAEHALPSVFFGHSAKYILNFFSFFNQTFCGKFLHYVDLYVPFCDFDLIIKSVSYNY